MTARQQWSIVGVVILVLGAGLWVATRVLADELFPVAVGTRAPEFSAMTLDPEPREVSLADHRGNVVLVNIWATWCIPCRKEMPSIERLHQEYSEHGLRVLAVSVDNAGAEQAIRDFVSEYELTFQILHDPANAISTRYHVTGYPESFLIDSDGVIRKKIIGETDWFSRDNRALVALLLGIQSESGLPDVTPASEVPVR